MKKLSLIFFLFLAASVFSQDDLKTITDITITLRGLDESNIIPKSKIIKLHNLELAGADAKKYKIISYVMTYAYDNGMTEESMDSDEISKEMNQFFHIIEKNCRLTFKDVVVKHSDNNKIFKIPQVAIIIHANE